MIDCNIDNEKKLLKEMTTVYAYRAYRIFAKIVSRNARQADSKGRSTGCKCYTQTARCPRLDVARN